eukprot:scaffold34688_cov234-Amphora_coffeaeformis.AAC.6
MSDAGKENLSQEEKLTLWRSQRDKNRGNIAATKPPSSQKSRRPVLRPLPNRVGDTRRIRTPSSSFSLQSTPLQSQHHSNLSKSTPFSHQSSSASTKGSLPSRSQPSSDKSRSSFLQPTSSSSRKSSVGGQTRPLSHTKLSDNHRRFSSSITSRRKSGGLLSRPPVRLSTPSSVSSSFQQLSDRPHGLENDNGDDEEDDHHRQAGVSVKSITIASPRLPMTSPLAVFSPAETTTADKGTGHSPDETSIGGLEIEPRNNLHSRTQGDMFSIDINYAELKRRHVDHVELPSSSSREDRSERKRIRAFQEVRSTIQSEEEEKDEIAPLNKSGSRREDDAAMTLSSEKKLDEELPALNAALNEFSNLNLSFNLDSSSDEEQTSFRPCRISRDRSRVLGPILPIPSLRDDFEEQTKTPKLETPSPTILEEESSPSFILSQLSLPSPFQATNAVSRELLDSANGSSLRSRVSRDGSKKNLGLLLPIPSLRDDLSEKKESSSPKDNADSMSSPKDSDESPISISLPSPAIFPSRTIRREKLSNVLETDEDDVIETRTSRALRHRKNRDLSLLLPVPSLREDLPDKNDVPSPPSNPTSPLNSPAFLPSSPLNATLPAHKNTCQDGDPLEDSSPQLLNELTGDQKGEFAEFDISSPVVEDLPVRRRGRESILLPTPLIQKEEDSGKVPGDDTPRETDVSHQVTQPEDAETSQCLDSMPLVKYKDRHVLAAVPEIDTPAIEALQEQLSQVVTENRKQAERLARYNRSYEDRVTPYRNLFEEWREQKRRWAASEVSHNALVEEVQGKFAQALQLSLQKCQDLQEQLQASQERVASLEQQLETT